MMDIYALLSCALLCVKCHAGRQRPGTILNTRIPPPLLATAHRITPRPCLLAASTPPLIVVSSPQVQITVICIPSCSFNVCEQDAYMCTEVCSGQTNVMIPENQKTAPL